VDDHKLFEKESKLLVPSLTQLNEILIELHVSPRSLIHHGGTRVLFEDVKDRVYTGRATSISVTREMVYACSNIGCRVLCSAGCSIFIKLRSVPKIKEIYRSSCATSTNYCIENLGTCYNRPENF